MALRHIYARKMKTLRLFWLPAILATAFAFVPSARSANTPEPGPWQSLFNGRDLSGWVPMHEVNFVVTNGNLRLVKGMGWLRSEAQFTNFVLEVEWRALESSYDSGFFLRAVSEGKPWPQDAWQLNLKDNALGGLLKGYKTMVPAETPRMPVGQWVKFRLEVRGRKIILDVDGERAWEFSEFEADRGYVGIQAEDKVFEFRNLHLQPLSADGNPAAK